MIYAAARYLRTDFLDNNEKYFIPVFQRNYSWTQKECKELLEDIFSRRDNTTHFIGNIITQRITDNSNFTVKNIVIDGQQRITTTIIIVKALLDLTNDINEKKALNDFIFDHRNQMPKIKLNIHDNKQMNYLFENDWDKIKKDTPIYSNYLFCKNYISSKISNENVSISEIIQYISRLVFVHITLDTSDDAQTIFERINSTGVDLSNADLIRNFLLMSEYDQDMLYTKYWSKMEEILNSKQMISFIQVFLNYKTDKTTSDKNVYFEFKKFFKFNNLNREQILEEMLEMSKLYSNIIRVNEIGQKEIDLLLEQIFRLNQSTCHSFMLHVLKDYKDNKLSTNQLFNVLKINRNYLVRRIIVDRKALKNLNKFFAGLYKKIYQPDLDDNVKYENYSDIMISYFNQIPTTDRLPSDLEFAQALEENNFYVDNKICKYILEQIESDASKEKIDFSNLTIEHIMPQNKNNDWRDEIGEKYDEVMDKYLHNIGNLTLTAYNSELSDDPYLIKKEKLLKLNSRMKILNLEIEKFDKWNENIIIDRNKRLSQIIIEIFKNLESKNNYLFSDIEIKHFDLDNYGELNKSKLEKIVIYGDEIYLKDYTKLLTETFNWLYRNYPEKIRMLAQSKFSNRNNQKPDISFDSQDINRNRKIENSDIYINYNMTPNDILSFVESVFEEMELDKNSFEFYLAD